jgi:hypothetical protein
VNAAEVLDTAIASPSSASTFTAVGDVMDCAEIVADKEELKSVC